jgi:hypothetical protein
MNRIVSTNENEVLTQIMEQASVIAAELRPITYLNISASTGTTIAELLDLEAQPTMNNRQVVIKVTDPSDLLARLRSLRSESQAPVKRMITSFTSSLNEAVTSAQRNHVASVANETRVLVSGSGNIVSNDRPLSGHSISSLTDTHNILTNFLLNQDASVRINYGRSEDDEFVTTFVGLPNSVSVTTKSRFKAFDDGLVSHRYRHEISTANTAEMGAGVLSHIRNNLRNTDSVMVKRHNKTLNGAVKHMVKFVLRAIEMIEAELEARTADLAEKGLTLEIAYEPIAYEIPDDFLVTSTESEVVETNV